MAKRRINIKLLVVLIFIFILSITVHAKDLQNFNEFHTPELFGMCNATTNTYIPICDNIGKPIEGKYVIEKEYVERFGGANGCGVNDIGATPKLLEDGSYECTVIQTVGGNDCLGRCGAGCSPNPPWPPSHQMAFTQECFNHDLCVWATGMPRGGLTGPCGDECSAARYGYSYAPDCMDEVGDLFVSALDEMGTTYLAPQDGIYTFMIVGGAYEHCPPESQPDHPEWWGWLTGLWGYINRPISWSAPCWEEYPGPGNSDFELGDWTHYKTYRQAEKASKYKHNIELALNKDEFVTFVIQDCKECCFWDNSGGVNLRVYYRP